MLFYLETTLKKYLKNKNLRKLFFFNSFGYFLILFSCPIFFTNYFADNYFELQPLKIIFTFFFTLVLCYKLPNEITKVSDLFISLIFFLIILPSLTLFAYDVRFQWEYLFSMLVTFFMILIFKELPFPIKIPDFKLKEKYFIFLFVIILSIGTIYLINDVGISSFNLNPKLVYQYRFQEITSKSSYLFSWLSRVIIPLLAVISLRKKSFLLLIFSFFSLFIIYGISSEKSLLIIPLVSIFISIFCSKIRSISITIVPFLLGSLILISAILYINFDFVYFPSMVVRRSIFVPSQVIFYYFDFFDNNQFSFWSHNLIGKQFSEYPYDLPIGQLINKAIFKKDLGSLNASFFGAAFMQAGLIGNIIYGIIMGYILNYIDLFENFYKERESIIAASFAPLVVIFTSADLPTGLVTHGLLISLIIMPFLPSRNSLKLKD